MILVWTKESRIAQLGAENVRPIVFERTYPQEGAGDNTQEISFGAYD
jgi:hypothetical protein